MTDVPDLTTELILLRVERTKPEQLRTSAKAFDDAAAEFKDVRGRMNGVIADTASKWDSTAGRSFATHSDIVLRGLGDVGYTLGFLGRHLREHAKLAEEAKAGIQQFRTGPSDHPYRTTDIATQNILDAVAELFHESELKLKKAFFSWGAMAPGRLPVPDLPPAPKQAWWESLLFGPGPEPTWVTKDGDPWFGEGEAYGYDEDGNLVPAYMAAYPDEWYRYQQAGIPVGAIFKWLGRGARAGGRGLGSADEFMDVVKASNGWRDAHIERHIREFYRLDATQPVPQWAKDEFAAVVRAAGTDSGKVFGWSLPPAAGTAERQATYAILYRDPSTKQWLAVQFYKSGPRAGEFATAFKPTPSQINRMLQENALG